MSSEYPLHWPPGWGRNKTPKTSQFKTSLAGALKNVNKSVDIFARDSGKKVTDVLISSNVTLGQQRPKDSGVAIYFKWDDIATCIAVDRYQKVEDNLQAIHHCIEAERVKLRHGGINLVRAAFRGYAALPPGTGASSDSWWNVLECREDASSDVIKQQYKRLRSDHHPDKGGNAGKFNEIQQAYKEATRSLH